MSIRKKLSVFPVFLAIILFLNGVCSCSASEITSISQLNNPRYTVGTDIGGPVNQNVREFLPEAKVLTFDSLMNEYLALQNGKVDAFACNEAEFLAAQRNGIKNMKRLPGVLGNPMSIAAGISDSSKIPELREKFNSFLAKIKADGTLTAMYQRWVYDGDMDMPKIDVPEKSDIHLIVGTTGLVMPFSFYIQGKIAGLDIELARRFAAYIGAEIEFKLYDFFSILMALKSGNIDIALSDLYVTAENSKSITFSDLIYKQNSIIAIRDDGEAVAPEKSEKSELQKRIPKYKTFAELDGKNIGMQPGIIDWEEWAAENLPHSKIQYYNTYPDLSSALKTHKIEGFLVDSPVLALMAAEDNELTAINEYIGESFGYHFICAKTERGKKLCDEMSEYIRKIKASGELDAIHSIWQGADEAAKIPPDFKNLPAKNGTLTYAAEGSYPPFTYYKGKELAGIDIDIAARFCKAYGYGLNVQIMFFDAMLPAINSGKIDFAGDFTPSEEHEEAVYYSDPYCEAHSLMACLKAEEQPARSLDEALNDSYLRPSDHTVNISLKEFAGKRVGLLIGSDSAKAIESKIPGVKLTFFDSFGYILPALRSGKIDAFYCAVPTAVDMIRTYGDLAYIPEYVSITRHTAMFPETEKGRKLCAEYADFLNILSADGTIKTLTDKWINGSDNSIQETEDYSNLPSPNGVMRLSVTEGAMPFVFVKNNRVQGYDIDLAVLFCKSKGCGLEIEITNHNGVLSSLETGKCDFSYSVQWTEERSKTVLFSSTPNAVTGSVLVVLKPENAEISKNTSNDAINNASNNNNNEPSFWEDVASSFNKTFIRENRWELFIEGITNTMIITASSILCGIMLGFIAFMFCRTGNRAANAVTKIYVWLIKGTPIVVLLMILYYIIFGRVNISGIVVSIIAFTLTFSTSVYRMLTFGTGAVDRGQTEAAYALGFTDLQTFFTVILPQAALHFMPSFKEEVTMLIKSTSVVGYIAVQDLTKMGDIIRSRTYEAFFPLIAIAVIYFILAGLLNIIADIIKFRITPSKRKPENILSGIDTSRGNKNYD